MCNGIFNINYYLEYYKHYHARSNTESIVKLGFTTNKYALGAVGSYVSQLYLLHYYHL